MAGTWQAAGDAVLAGLLRQAHARVPALHASIVATTTTPGDSAGGWSCTDDALALARAVLMQLREHDPQAAPAYWSLRAWTLLIWQPIYLGVFAVRLTGGWLCLEGLRQQASGARMAGCQVLPGSLRLPPPGVDPRVSAARAIASLLAPLHAALNAALPRPLPHKAARRLQADCVLAALLRVHPAAPPARHAELHQEAARWLALLDLAGESGYLSYPDPAGGALLALDRRVCCLDHRRPGGDVCSVCPRLPLHERRTRLAQERAVLVEHRA